MNSFEFLNRRTLEKKKKKKDALPFGKHHGTGGVEEVPIARAL
jgi:hypothetical protein